jgi:hypothetical protein
MKALGWARNGAIAVFLCALIAGLALYSPKSPEPSSTISLREVRIKDAAVFHGPSHDTSKFVAFVEAVIKKTGSAPMQECRMELFLVDQSFLSSRRREFGPGDSDSVVSILIFVPRGMYRKAGNVRMVCKTGVTDLYPVELPDLEETRRGVSKDRAGAT